MSSTGTDAKLGFKTRINYRSQAEKHIIPCVGRQKMRAVDHCNGRPQVQHRTTQQHDCDQRCRPHVCKPLKTAANKFTAQGTLDRMVRAHAGLKAAAVTLFKIANDLRWLGSGPRTGIHELIFPSNEPGSSIMPGKVNPTQAEAMLMVAIQVIGADVSVTMGGAEGNFELNAFRPILIDNYLHSALIMADMCDHFGEFMVEGVRLNEAKLKENIERSVMMVTALSPVIGYDKAAAISYYAIDHELTLKQAALANGVGEDLFDRVVKPLALTRPGTADVPSNPGKA